MSERSANDPYLTELYDHIHDTPMQRKFRRIAPTPAGVVFIQWPGMGEKEIREHFRTIKSLGFTCLKGIQLTAGADHCQVMRWALDEGIIPWWYGEGGWEEISDALLDKLGIDRNLPIEAIREHPKMTEYQTNVLRRRIDRLSKPDPHPPSADGVQCPTGSDHRLDPKALPFFMEWLKKRYGTLDRLHEAWNIGRMVDSAPGAWSSWDALSESMLRILQHNVEDRGREFRRICDVLRFKADIHLERLRKAMKAAIARDPDEPHRAGGEAGLFLPFAAMAIDMEGIAHVMSEYGSFYPSIHLGWHFEEVDFEIARPAYMMSSLASDWGKGVWSAAWESSGGPQQISGGKAPFWPPARDKMPGLTVDGGVMTQLMLSYLAGGFRGFGFWCWTARQAGFEAGEYALTDRQGRPSDRAVQAGKIAQAVRRYRDELWKTHKEPLVGVFVDFDLSAMWATAAVGGRDFFKHMPMQARVGVSRALIDRNVPWEYVTACDLRSGLAGRYRVIYLPAAMMLADDVAGLLLDYAKQGGRVVVDMPGAMYDEFGRVANCDSGTRFEQIFGCVLRDIQYSSNVPRALDGRRLQGFVADLLPTHARVVAEYDAGLPAITEASVGKGTAVILAFEASLMCYKSGDKAAEECLVRHTLGRYESPYACDGAIAYRLAAPAADHYFLINDGPARSVLLDTKAFRYRGAVDAVTQEALSPGQPIALPAYGGRWVRCAMETD